MANRFWVGGSATWDGTAGTKWSTTSGGAGGAAVPTAADVVAFDATSGTVNVSVTGTRVCHDIITAGFTGSISFGSTVLTFGNNTGSAILSFDDAAGATYDFGTSEFICNDIFAGVVAPVGMTVNKVTVPAGKTLLTGDSTFDTLELAAGSLWSGAGFSTLFLSNLIATGTSGNEISITSDNTGDAFTISTTSGTIACDYLVMIDCHATGGASFYAGSHSFDGGNNTGWSFTDPVAGVIPVPKGSIASSGKIPVFKQDFAQALGSTSLTGLAPTLKNNRDYAILVGTLSLAGQVPGTEQKYTIPLKTASISGFAPTVAQAIVPLPPAGTLSLSAQLISILDELTTPSQSLSLDAKTPEVRNETIFFIPKGALRMSHFDEITISNPQHTYRSKRPKAGTEYEQFVLGELEHGYGMSYAEDVGSTTLSTYAPAYKQNYGEPLGTVVLSSQVPVFKQDYAMPVGARTLTALTPTVSVV